MWVTKLLISPVKKRIFCPKTTKFGPKLAFLVNLGQAMQAYSVPCWWVGWWLWRAGCISQDTYLLYNICFANHNLHSFLVYLFCTLQIALFYLIRFAHHNLHSFLVYLFGKDTTTNLPLTPPSFLENYVAIFL